MKRRFRIISLIIAAGVMAGCAPAITVENRTRVPVRVIVRQLAAEAMGYYAFSTVLSPRPGQSSSVPALGEGTYSVAVANEATWVAYAKEKRFQLEAKLGDPQKLSGQKLQDFIKSMNDIPKQFESDVLISCQGRVGNMDEDILVQVVLANNSLSAICESTKAKR